MQPKHLRELLGWLGWIMLDQTKIDSTKLRTAGDTNAPPVLNLKSKIHGYLDEAKPAWFGLNMKTHTGLLEILGWIAICECTSWTCHILSRQPRAIELSSNAEMSTLITVGQTWCQILKSCC